MGIQCSSPSRIARAPRSPKYLKTQVFVTRLHNLRHNGTLDALASNMENIRSLFVVLGLLTCFVPFSAKAADVAVFPVETPNVAPADAVAIGELLAQSYAAVSGQAVLAPSRIQLTAPQYEQAAKELGVKEYVRTSAVGFGTRLTVQSVRYQADGTQLYQVKLTAERIDDMPAVADRIARSLYLRVDDEQVRTRHNVTLSEARPATRTWSEKVIGFKTGLHLPFAKDADMSPSLSGMFDLRMEADRYFIEIGAGIMIPTKTREYDGCWDGEDCMAENTGRLGGLISEIGGSYFLTDSDIAPYIGGGLMPRLQMATDDDDVANLSVFGQVGLTLPRDSSTRIYADLRVAQHVLAIHLDNGARVHPTEISLQAGVGW